ncbi:hypothetical protein TEQG_01303 [Trichophyton equinum CBS 127.97]|uniref:Uncharacterized protein n=1 Tax=Trichophyton equinum (strain ATCC MYA-4606 / CBS 127.97) TaxID=559882 RepID=F2PK45_TRIEC|nr:hypothetical protein TEQG_01303 [Trichophyton equinum CBS 127.97]
MSCWAARRARSISENSQPKCPRQRERDKKQKGRPVRPSSAAWLLSSRACGPEYKTKHDAAGGFLVVPLGVLSICQVSASTMNSSSSSSTALMPSSVCRVSGRSSSSRSSRST